MQGLWPLCDPVTSSWPCTDSIVTSCWPFFDPALNSSCRLNPSCEQCGHTHSALQSNKEVYLSWWSGWSLRWEVWSDPLWSTSSVYLPHLLWTWLSSTCDLYTWPESSQLSCPFDHMLMSHMTTPSPWGLWWSHPGVMYTTQMPTDVPAVSSFMCLSDKSMRKWSLNPFWPFDLLYWCLGLLLHWNLRKGFSFPWISCFLWPRGDG